jgi:hypothetical protein
VKIDRKTFKQTEEAVLNSGPICSIANSSETIYVLTGKGSLSSVAGET